MKLCLLRFGIICCVVAITALVAGCGATRERTPGDAGNGVDANRLNRTDTAYAQDGVEDATPKATSLRVAGEPTTLVEVFPGVMMDRERGVIVLKGTVPIETAATDSKAAKPVYLEVMVCSRDTKEHEALVVVSARPSHVHAALLMLGMEPGRVGTWREEAGAIVGIPATGPELDVKVRWKDGDRTVAAPILSWVVDQRTKQDLAAVTGGGLVFAGSRFASVASRASPDATFEAYMADIDGTLVGLTTFSSECIAWSKMHHHQSKVEEPRWIANPKLVPKFGTEVEVVIMPAR